MTNLSPDAQKVLDASMVHSGPAFETIVRRMLADALRTAADQLYDSPNALFVDTC
jgi:plasmid stabilization system protein ParE